jgi:hypothetical protein
VTRPTDPRNGDGPTAPEDEPGFDQSDLVGGSRNQLVELEGLRRRLDPEHPDPDRLRRRIELARRPPASSPSATTLDPITLSPATAPGTLTEEPRRGRRAWGGAPVLVAAVAVLVVLLVGAVVLVRGSLGDRGLGVAATPTAPASTTPAATRSPSPTPAPAPAGFRDCSQSLGAGAYCAETAECWAGVIGVADVPFVGNPIGCRESHVYQTFAAGLVETPPRRQAQFEKLAVVKRLCSRTTLGLALGGNASAKGFEIIALPPQTDSEPVVRCIAGRGERKTPLDLQPR